MKRIIIVLAVAALMAGCKESPRQISLSEQLTGFEHVNVILMIGDGMGIAQLQSGIMASDIPLNITKLRHIGFQNTKPAGSDITDSGASSTAMSTGTKTYNGRIAVDTTGKELKTILEYAEEAGLSTGLISTSAITHATPASFVAHHPDRNDYQAIAKDFLDTEFELIMGGGWNHFNLREDGLVLTDTLKSRGYGIFRRLPDKLPEEERFVVLADSVHMPPASKRGDFLPDATAMALKVLRKNKDGFFLMVEGSQIDWAGHANDTEYMVREVLDFDRAVGQALEFAKKNPNTLLIVTADHETGGMVLYGRDEESNTLQAGFNTDGHSALMVPVFAYGPGASEFHGFYENTAIFDKMKKVFGF